VRRKVPGILSEIMEAANGFEPLNGGLADLSASTFDLKKPCNAWPRFTLGIASNHELSSLVSENSRTVWPVPDDAYFDGRQ